MATAATHTPTPATGPDTRPPRRRPTNRPPTPPRRLMLTTPDRPSDWPNPVDLTTHTPGQTDRPEPHPWGAPLPASDPYAQHLRARRRAAISRWVAYVVALAVVVVAMTWALLAATTAQAADTPNVGTLGHATTETPDTLTGPAAVDALVQLEDGSRYHGPNLTPAPEGVGR